MKKIIFLLLLSFSTLLLGADKKVVFETNVGEVTFLLYPQIAPKTVENFVGLVEKGYYDGIIFHRVIKNFMIQGGDPTGTGRGGESLWGKPFADEFSPGVVFDRSGLLAMANAGRNTNGSQFFITTIPTPWLNGRHTIFGEVVDGYSVIKKIEETKVDGRDKPINEVKILKAYIR
jgi:peptidylprolyl isomerase